MAGIRDFEEIIDNTPIEQAILLDGIHGIGKSEYISAKFKAMGYEVVTLFLGQTADAGDIIGLPNRKTIKMQYNGEEIDQVITEFCPPKWWPFNENDKLIIFFDEFNRGKPEIYQCIMDMVLNRKLNGFDLPKQTRIIAAMNPNGEEYDYDVTILDRALLDRFNKYEFHPTTEEWITWATKNDVNKYVIGYISKNQTDLDPPKSVDEELMNEVYPSRRSWVRVSEILKANPNIIHSTNKIFETMLYGVIGRAVTGKFVNYIAKAAKGINPALIVTRWDDNLKARVEELSNIEYSSLNKELATWLSENYDTIECVSGKEQLQYARNVGYYIDVIPHELAIDFLDYLLKGHQAGEHWGDFLLTNNDKILDMYSNALKD